MTAEFASILQQAIAMEDFDLVVGFDKLVHTDVQYCADPSIKARMKRQPYLFLLPRYRAYLALEGTVFASGSRTKVLLLSQRQLSEYWNAWHTAPERLILLPPTIAASRRHPDYRRNGVGARLRQSLGFTPQDWVWLAVAVQPITKGLDRSLRALREFPTAKLVVAGLSPTSSSNSSRA